MAVADASGAGGAAVETRAALTLRGRAFRTGVFREKLHVDGAGIRGLRRAGAGSGCREKPGRVAGITSLAFAGLVAARGGGVRGSACLANRGYAATGGKAFQPGGSIPAQQSRRILHGTRDRPDDAQKRSRPDAGPNPTSLHDAPSVERGRVRQRRAGDAEHPVGISTSGAAHLGDALSSRAAAGSSASRGYFRSEKRALDRERDALVSRGS